MLGQGINIVITKIKHLVLPEMIIDVDSAIPDKAWLLEKRSLIRLGYLMRVGVELYLIRPSFLFCVNEVVPEKAWFASVWSFAWQNLVKAGMEFCLMSLD